MLAAITFFLFEVIIFSLERRKDKISLENLNYISPRAALALQDPPIQPFKKELL